MNTQSNAVPEAVDSQAMAPAATSATQPFYWAVRRELWEYRSIYVAPVAAAALALFGFLISTFNLRERMRAVSALSPMRQQEAIQQPYMFAELLIMGIAFVVAIFYSLDALHGERRDRSILFWKSLPVSDAATVLSKASIPLVVVPLLTFAITVATQWVMLLINAVALLGSGYSVATLWANLALAQMWGMLLYHLVTVHSLWYAPIYGWLLLVSAWARRVPFLWAFLPLFAVGAVEKIAFNTTHFGHMLQQRLAGGPEAVPITPGGMSMHTMTHLTPGRFLVSPGLWIGLALAAAFLAAAVRLRRYRGPI